MVALHWNNIPSIDIELVGKGAWGLEGWSEMKMWWTHVSEAKIMFDPKDLLGYIVPEPKEVEQPEM